MMGGGSKMSATKETFTIDTVATNVVLETLKKRLNDDDDSVNGKAAMEASDLLLEHLEELQLSELREAAVALDVSTVESLLEAGVEMDEEMTEATFWSVVKAVDDAEAQDLALSSNVTVMLHHVFDADLNHLLSREQIRTNLTCKQPDDSGGVEGASRRMNYVFDDGDHKNLPLMEGRACAGGTCCDECSRNVFPTFASQDETDLDIFPELASLTFNDLEKVSAGTIMQFIRLIERVRRTMAHEYGLDLSTLLPLQAYSRKYVAGTTQKGGGGGEGDFVTLHTDESTHEGYHYSCVIYLSTHGKDFEGGNFVFNDPGIAPDVDEPEEKAHEFDISESLLESLKNGELPDRPLDWEDENSMSLEESIRRAGRELKPYRPTRGSAVIFSSGWENMHEVEKITSGIRYAVPCFFTTCPVPDIAYDQMKVGKPQSDEDIADDWLHLLLAHRKEEPMESVGRVKELLMKWHTMCTPLNRH